MGGRGNDYLDGGPGNDYLFGGDLQVRADGSTYVDSGSVEILNGGPGNDYLEAGGGSVEILDGGPGNDHLATSADVAALIGGPGADVFDVTQSGIVKIMDFQDGADKILLATGAPNYYGPTEYLELHQLAARAGVQFDMGWIATEVDNGVTLPLKEYDNHELTIEGAYLANLQFEVVGGDLFIV